MRTSQSIALLLALAAGSSDAFTPASNSVLQQTRASPLFSVSPKEEEKTLRREIAEKASVVEDEQKYTLKDGEGMQGIFLSDTDADTDAEATAPSKESFEARMERMMKPRAYPLFLAEKAAEIVEHAIDDVFKGSPSFEPTNGLKEKIVVLGTGWGAASFLKDVDTDRYDVTVISPRNYFLFTPMLAGASVGTVEYRSITEPIREVSCNSHQLVDFMRIVTCMIRISYFKITTTHRCCLRSTARLRSWRLLQLPLTLTHYPSRATLSSAMELLVKLKSLLSTTTASS
jgi:hypothetical protein